jgi:hypothetical protein
MSIFIKNKYGSVLLTPVTGYMPIVMISEANLPIVNDHLFSMDDSEAIALITGNKNIQVSHPFILNNQHPNREKGYLIHHESPNVACVCKVEIERIEIDNGNSAQQEIESVYQNSGEKYKNLLT